MVEFATSFKLSGQFMDENGKSAPFIHIAEALQLAFILLSEMPTNPKQGYLVANHSISQKLSII
jgi:hypothetical protein